MGTTALKSAGDAVYDNPAKCVACNGSRGDSPRHRARSLIQQNRWRFIIAPCVLLLGSFGAGCDPFAQTVRLSIVFDRTGSLTSDGVFSSITTNNAALIGDLGDDKAVKAFVSVNLNAIPDGANVSRAVLRFDTHSAFGNPFGDFVTLTVDHVNVVTTIGAAAFNGNVLTGSIAPFPQLPANGAKQTLELDITNPLKADLAAGRPISSYRFQFNSAPTRDGQFDVVFIDAFAEDANVQPVAIVTFNP